MFEFTKIGVYEKGNRYKDPAFIKITNIGKNGSLVADWSIIPLSSTISTEAKINSVSKFIFLHRILYRICRFVCLDGYCNHFKPGI